LFEKKRRNLLYLIPILASQLTCKARNRSMNKETKMHRHEDEDSSLTRLPELAQPLLQFDLAEEIEHLQREDSWQRCTGRSSRTLVKQPDFRIVLVAMKAATEMKEHQADGRISIHTIVGHLRVKLPDQMVEVPAGHLLALDRCIEHDVEALVDSIFLLTIAWPKDAA
jgi:quercetin dioxygenase-like cupin family protein